MSLRIRPTFHRIIACPPGRVQRHIERAMIQRDAPCRGEFYDRHAILDLPEDERHVWSPQLSLDLEQHPDGTHVRGLFAPRPSIWTFYVTAYAFLGFGGIIGLMFGTSQWSLGMEATALWSVPFAMVLASLIYGTAWVGQRLSRDQLETLETFIDRVLTECPTTSPDPSPEV